LIKSSTTPDFWKSYSDLPAEIQEKARHVYRLWQRDPRHPSLRFKKVAGVWSIRITSDYRALATEAAGTFYWFWIGSHAEYDRLLNA
jgi:hypothetical protein